MAEVEALTRASMALAGAAATISASRAAYAPAVMQLIREANDAITAVRDRGLAKIQRTLAKLQDKLDREAREKAAPGESAGGDLGAVPRGDRD